MLIAVALMIPSGLVLIGIGWRARHSQGWGHVWAGAMPVAWGTFLAVPETAVAVRYVAAAAAAVFLVLVLASVKRELFRVRFELLMAAVALGAIAALELLAPPPWLVSVLLVTLVLAMTAFVVGSSIKVFRALRMRSQSPGPDQHHA